MWRAATRPIQFFGRIRRLSFDVFLKMGLFVSGDKLQQFLPQRL